MMVVRNAAWIVVQFVDRGACLINVCLEILHVRDSL